MGDGSLYNISYKVREHGRIKSQSLFVLGGGMMREGYF